jgi:hypothetical protein
MRPGLLRPPEAASANITPSGYGGNGITFSAIAARLVTDLLVGRQNPDAEVFRFGRQGMVDYNQGHAAESVSLKRAGWQAGF